MPSNVDSVRTLGIRWVVCALKPQHLGSIVAGGSLVYKAGTMSARASWRDLSQRININFWFVRTGMRQFLKTRCSFFKGFKMPVAFKRHLLGRT